MSQLKLDRAVSDTIASLLKDNKRISNIRHG